MQIIGLHPLPLFEYTNQVMGEKSAILEGFLQCSALIHITFRENHPKYSKDSSRNTNRFAQPGNIWGSSLIL